MSEQTGRRKQATTASPKDGDGTTTTAVLVPTEQRLVTIVDDEEIPAALIEGQDIYLPIRPMCQALGVASQMQIARIKADEVMAENLRRVRLVTPGGPQTVQALHIESVPLWLGTLEPGRVREDLRPRLIAYKRWMQRRVYEAFAAEIGWGRPGPPVPAPPTAVAPASLEYIEQMALAIAHMARQQLIFEHDLTDARDHMEVLDGRVDRAAAVVGGMLRDLKALQAALTPGALITTAQAAEISNSVKTLAESLTRAVPGKNHYQGLFGELYRRFRVPSYREVTVDQFPAVMAWLRDFQRSLDEGTTPAT